MWTSLLPIIAQYGLPVAEKIWLLTTKKTDPTQADWDELKALAQKTSADYLAEAAAKKG